MNPKLFQSLFLLELLLLYYKGVEGGCVELNTECPGGYQFQRNTQQLGELIFNFLKDKSQEQPPLEPNWYAYQADEGFINQVLETYKQFGGRGPIALIAEEDTHGKDGEDMWLVESLKARTGQTCYLVDPSWIDQGGHYQGQKITLAFRDITTATSSEKYLNQGKSLNGLLDLAKEDRVMNPLSTTPAGTRKALEILSQNRQKLPRLVRQLTLWSSPLTLDLVLQILQEPDKYVLKKEGSYSGMGVLIGGVHNQQIKKVIKDLLGRYIDNDDWQNEGWSVQEKLDLNIWKDKFYVFVGDKSGKIDWREETLDTRLFVSRGVGAFGLLARFNEKPPTNVGSGGGSQAVLVVDNQNQAQGLKDWYRRTIEKISQTDLAELEDEVAQKATELQHWYINGPIRYTIDPRIFTRSEVWYLNLYATQLSTTVQWLVDVLKNSNELKFSLNEASLINAQGFTNRHSTILASDLLVRLGVSR